MNLLTNLHDKLVPLNVQKYSFFQRPCENVWYLILSYQNPVKCGRRPSSLHVSKNGHSGVISQL
jgi:hypothetical protein